MVFARPVMFSYGIASPAALEASITNVEVRSLVYVHTKERGKKRRKRKNAKRQEVKKGDSHRRTYCSACACGLPWVDLVILSAQG